MQCIEVCSNLQVRDGVTKNGKTWHYRIAIQWFVWAQNVAHLHILALSRSRKLDGLVVSSTCSARTSVCQSYLGET